MNGFVKIVSVIIVAGLMLGNLALAINKKDVAPEFNFLEPKEGEELKEDVDIKGKVKNALSVEFYERSPGAISSVYLGRAASLGENIWQYFWNTRNTPNSNYELFAKITNQYGEYESSRIGIKIENAIKQEKEQGEKLKKELKETEGEIKKEEEKITEKKEEVKKEALNKSEELVKETTKLLEEPQKKLVEPKVNEKLASTTAKTEENIEKLVVQVKEEKKAEKELREKEKEKEELKKEVSIATKELNEAKKAEENLPEGQKKEEAKIIKEQKQEKLGAKKEQQEKVEKELPTLKTNQEKIKQEKEETKKEIIEKTVEIIKPIEEILPKEKVPEEIQKIKKEVKENINSQLEALESTVKEKEEIKIEKGKTLVKDSDGDELSDMEEISLNTDPFNPDSDGDGFLDGQEVESGYDPLKAGPSDKKIYGDPRKFKPKGEDVYKVERVEPIKLAAGEPGLKIEGKGLPDSFVTVYVFSSAIVMTTRTDGSGNWSLSLDKTLSDGYHEVYVAVTNNQGEITSRSDPLVFLKSGEKVAAIVLGAFPTEETIFPAKAVEKRFLLLIVGIIAFGIGIALTSIGFLTRKRPV